MEITKQEQKCVVEQLSYERNILGENHQQLQKELIQMSDLYKSLRKEIEMA